MRPLGIMAPAFTAINHVRMAEWSKAPDSRFPYTASVWSVLVQIPLLTKPFCNLIICHWTSLWMRTLKCINILAPKQSSHSVGSCALLTGERQFPLLSSPQWESYLSHWPSSPGACCEPPNTRTFWGWSPNPRTVLGLDLVLGLRAKFGGCLFECNERTTIRPII